METIFPDIWMASTNSAIYKSSRSTNSLKYFRALQYNTIQYNKLNTINYNTIQYNTVQYNTNREMINYCRDFEKTLYENVISSSLIKMNPF